MPNLICTDIDSWSLYEYGKEIEAGGKSDAQKSIAELVARKDSGLEVAEKPGYNASLTPRQRGSQAKKQQRLARRLNVFLHGEHVGVLSPQGQGVEFRYDHDVPLDSSFLSMSLPAIRRGRFSAQKASAYFDGLLPDGPEARLRMARSLGSLDTSTFSLLSRGGLDCAGAVQFYEGDSLPVFGELIPVTDAEIGERLLNALESPAFANERFDRERWAVSGAQGKIALRLEGERWHVATGSEPHSHILKPGISLRGDIEAGQQALVEHVTMKAATSLGVNAASTTYQEFDGVPCVADETITRTSLLGMLTCPKQCQTHSRTPWRAAAHRRSRRDG